MQFWDEFPECIFGLQSLDLHPDITVECLFGTQSLDLHSSTVVVLTYSIRDFYWVVNPLAEGFEVGGPIRSGYR